MQFVPLKKAAGYSLIIIISLLFILSGCGSNINNTPVSNKNQPATTPVQANTPTITSTPTATPLPSPTPLPVAMPIPTPPNPLYVYHSLAEGETLSYIALHYNTTIDELVAMNDLPGSSALLQAGQTLRVPAHIDNLAPSNQLLPDSEVVYGPSYVDFDLAGFVKKQGGYLSTYYEYVDGQKTGGAEIIKRVSEQFSVGPRLLLALLEHYGGWVTNPSPSAEGLKNPLGPRNPRGDRLSLAMEFTANRINAGYYSYKRDGFWIFSLADYSKAITPPGLNAGTVGTQNILAVHSDRKTWEQELTSGGFMVDYRKLFGRPERYAVEPLVPSNLVQPSLDLPWQAGMGFYFTGGPHSAFVDGSGWAAVDFGPPDVLGNCFYSDKPSTAAGDGVVIIAKQGEIQLDLDGDGNIQTGWVLLYLHVALDAVSPVQVGQRVSKGDVIGYASCEGGLSNSSHLHFARRYNGEWIDAGGQVPMELSGWVVQDGLVPYEGTITNGADIREACECWDAELNLMIKPTE